MIPEILKKLQDTVDNPGFYRSLSAEEQAALFLALFAPKPKLFQKPKVIKGIDGTTPKKDKDYLGKETAERLIADLSAKTRAELEGLVQAKLATITPAKDGQDAVITDELIQRIADLAQSMIVLPDFATLITMEPEAIRDSLELLTDGNKLAIDAIEGLPQRLKDIESRPMQVATGGISKNAVLKLIEENATSGADWSYYATTWSSEPTFEQSISGGDVYSYTLSGTTRYRYVPSTYDPSEDAFYSTFSGGALSGLIVARG